MTSQVVWKLAPSVCFGIDVYDNATNGSMVTSAITFNRIGSNTIGFAYNLTLTCLVSRVC